jgi:hypothetical protein
VEAVYMRNYQIYLIEEEFAYHYFGKERLIFNLFLEYIQSSGKIKSILQKQIKYITKNIPSVRLQLALENSLKSSGEFFFKNGVYYLNKHHVSCASLKIQNQYILLEAEGNYEAETAFFECIRKCESSFLALDFINQHYGWLKPPIREKKLYKEKTF